MKALLNDKGKEMWGQVFPAGTVPIKGACKYKTQIQHLGETSFYLVDWERLSDEERKLVLGQLAKKFNQSNETIVAEILKNGLPIRASLIRCVSMSNRYFY
jgi:hypothetical protein